MLIYETQAREYAEIFQQAQAKSRAERMRRFWLTLEMTFSKFPLIKPADRALVVLDLACGICEESRIVASFFSTGIPGFPSSEAHLVGIDMDHQSIQTAALLGEAIDPFHYASSYGLAIRSTFICGDATELERYPAIPPSVDLVLIRHQIVRRDPASFERMVRQGLRRLSPAGMMLVTSFHEVEQEALLKVLEFLPCEILFQKENPHSLPLKTEYPEGEIAIDKFVCLVRPNQP